MDCDLQDPPEEIPRLYAKALEGYDIVSRAGASGAGSRWLRRVAAALYFRAAELLHRACDMGTDYGTSASSRARSSTRSSRSGDRDRQYLLILHWLGFERAEIEFEHAERHAGEAARTRFAHADAGRDRRVFFQTTILLRWIVYLGLRARRSSALAARGLVHPRRLPRPTRTRAGRALAVLLLIVGGFIIIEPGVTGLYIGKIFDQVKDRPLYVVDEVVERREPDSTVGRR